MRALHKPLWKEVRRDLAIYSLEVSGKRVRRVSLVKQRFLGSL